VNRVADAAIRRTSLPAPPFTHLRRLTDAGGLYEHADGTVPRREQGYCLDDVARALVVVRRERDRRLDDLEEHYLSFVLAAQHADGRFRNRRGADLRWSGPPSVEDCWGRALWALGTAADDGRAIAAFELGARWQSRSPRAMAFAALGAAEVLRVHPRDLAAAELLADAATVIGVPGEDPRWAWPEQELTYASPALAEVIISAGDLLGDEHLLAEGLRMLTWLCVMQEHQGHLSTVPVGGWRPGVEKHRHDQQPIEAAATADACATAAAVTGDERWDASLFQAIAWFLGDNDTGVVMHDPLTGGGYDGLTPDGPNPNQGAESTLAMVATMQHARALAARTTRSATMGQDGMSR
jgi:hypothetical protein